MIPTKRSDADPSGGRGEDKPRGGEGQGGSGQVEPEKKEGGETEGSEEIGGEKREDRDELA